MTFVDASGSPCAGCSLYSYLAGTTTPTPTYTSAVISPGTQNTNPITLDAAGGATIWISLIGYKFVLKDASGAMIVINETGIYIDNGQGATITLIGPAIAINETALTITGP